jgi:SulP family sulfate permease
MASSIADQIGEDDPASIIATTLVAYSFSSILTGEYASPIFSLHQGNLPLQMILIRPPTVEFKSTNPSSGLSFFLLGALKLGTVVGFFPRHILVG